MDRVIVHEYEVRCGVCRRRDWQRGGRGRADLVGRVSRTLGSAILDVEPILRGRDNIAPGERVNRLDYDGDLQDDLTGGLDGDPRPWRWRCRHGHRLRWDDEDVVRQLDRGHDVVYLPAA